MQCRFSFPVSAGNFCGEYGACVAARKAKICAEQKENVHAKKNKTIKEEK